MTNEQLMLPRYKVIADYPNRPTTMPVGHILTLDKFGAGKYWHQYTENEPLHIEGQSSTKYPAVLKELRWFEDRKIKDLPIYIKDAFIPVTSEHHRVWIITLYEIETNTIVANNCKFSYNSFLLNKNLQQKKSIYPTLNY